MFDSRQINISRGAPLAQLVELYSSCVLAAAVRASNPSRGSFAAHRLPSLISSLWSDSGFTFKMKPWKRPKETRIKMTISQYVSSTCRLVLTRHKLQQPKIKPHCIWAIQKSFFKKFVQNCDSHPDFFFNRAVSFSCNNPQRAVRGVTRLSGSFLCQCPSATLLFTNVSEYVLRWLKEKWRPVFFIIFFLSSLSWFRRLLPSSRLHFVVFFSGRRWDVV